MNILIYASAMGIELSPVCRTVLKSMYGLKYNDTLSDVPYYDTRNDVTYNVTELALSYLRNMTNLEDKPIVVKMSRRQGKSTLSQLVTAYNNFMEPHRLIVINHRHKEFADNCFKKTHRLDNMAINVASKRPEELAFVGVSDMVAPDSLGFLKDPCKIYFLDNHVPVDSVKYHVVDVSEDLS